MPQYLKETVRRNVLEAGERVFAEVGYSNARMADIARAAGVSTGNLYRYFKNKEVLFDEVVDPVFVRRLERLLRRRVQALDGVADVRELEAGSVYALASEELLAFSLENRLKTVILLGRAAGSRYEGFAERTAQRLGRLAVSHFRTLDPQLRVDAETRLALAEIYRNFVASVVNLLASSDDPRKLRDAVGAYTRYHLAGMKALFERWQVGEVDSGESS